MVDHKMMVLFVSIAVAAASSGATAQDWRSESSQRNGACFYEDADYSGDYFCLRTGEQLDSLWPGTNDRISSIFTFGRAEVTVFRDNGFRGPSRRFDYDVPNLQDWNDRISSIRVQRRGGRGHSGSSGGYRDADRMIRRAYQDLLGREPEAEGLRHYRSLVIDDGWTEAQVREAIRESSEYRERSTMTQAKAEEIVRRAYLSVLNREPDAGSRGYVQNVLRKGWTQQDVERELRRSPEYRGR
jgi:hypothetical protein